MVTEDVQQRRRTMKRKAFCRWVNAHLKPEEHVDDIGQFYDGVAFARLTNFMLGQFIHEIVYEPSTHEERLQNLELLFEIWDDLNVNLRNKTVELIVDGDIDTTELLLWALIEWYEFKQQKLDQPALLRWVNTKVRGYAGAHIGNFNTSLKDGLTFCALVHATNKSILCWVDLDTCFPLRNLELAFEAALKNFGVPRLLDADDLVEISCPEEKSIMCYLAVLHRGVRLAEAQKPQASVASPRKKLPMPPPMSGPGIAHNAQRIIIKMETTVSQAKAPSPIDREKGFELVRQQSPPSIRNSAPENSAPLATPPGTKAMQSDTQETGSDDPVSGNSLLDRLGVKKDEKPKKMIGKKNAAKPKQGEISAPSTRDCSSTSNGLLLAEEGRGSPAHPESATCSGGHALQERTALNAYRCDDCGSQFDSGARVYDCEPCNFALCVMCGPLAGPRAEGVKLSECRNSEESPSKSDEPLREQRSKGHAPTAAERYAAALAASKETNSTDNESGGDIGEFVPAQETTVAIDKKKRDSSSGKKKSKRLAPIDSVAVEPVFAKSLEPAKQQPLILEPKLSPTFKSAQSYKDPEPVRIIPDVEPSDDECSPLPTPSPRMNSPTRADQPEPDIVRLDLLQQPVRLSSIVKPKVDEALRHGFTSASSSASTESMHEGAERSDPVSQTMWNTPKSLPPASHPERPMLRSMYDSSPSVKDEDSPEVRHSPVMQWTQAWQQAEPTSDKRHFSLEAMPERAARESWSTVDISADEAYRQPSPIVPDYDSIYGRPSKPAVTEASSSPPPCTGMAKAIAAASSAVKSSGAKTPPQGRCMADLKPRETTRSSPMGKFGSYTSTNREAKPSESTTYREMKVHFVVGEQHMSTVFNIWHDTTCEELSKELAQSIEGGDEYGLFEVIGDSMRHLKPDANIWDIAQVWDQHSDMDVGECGLLFQQRTVEFEREDAGRGAASWTSADHIRMKREEFKRSCGNSRACATIPMPPDISCGCAPDKECIIS